MCSYLKIHERFLEMMLLIVFISILGVSAQNGSRTRGQCERRHIAELMKKSNCRAMEQPVPVPVPEGYIAVSPSVAVVTRCQNMACRVRGHSCVPDPVYLNNWTIPVYAYTTMGTRSCTTATVEVHMGCLCQCSKTCGHNQVLIAPLCECRCDPEKRYMCEERRRLWDDSTCSCVCPPSQVSQCSTGEVFIPELCRCEKY